MSDKRPAFLDHQPRKDRGYRFPAEPSVGFPPERGRGYGPAPLVAEKFNRYETIAVTLGATAVFTEVGRFSGYPDAIDIWCNTAGMEVKLTDLELREESAISTEANTTIHTSISRRVVSARDPAGAGGQLLRVVGKWAATADIN